MEKKSSDSFDNLMITEQDRMPQGTQKADGSKRTVRRVFCALLILIAAAAVFLALLLNRSEIYPNVMIDSVSVGGMTGEEALRALEESGWIGEKYDSFYLRTYGGIAAEIDPVRAGVCMDAEEAVSEALQIGRDGGYFYRIGKYFECRNSSCVIDSSDTVLDPDYLEEKIRELAEQADELLAGKEISVSRTDGEMVIHKGQDDVRLDTEGLRERVLEAMEQGETEIYVSSLTTDLKCPDFNALYQIIYRDAADARFSDDGRFTVIPDEPGVRFDPVQAETLWERAEPGGDVRIPLETVSPQIHAEELESMLFHDLLGAVMTKYNDSGESRCANVRLAAEKVNGTIVYPGETFSFNSTVGERTAEAGFLRAPAYAGYDDITGEVGGGVCQVSTGIYAAALYSFLDVTAHTCHVHPTNYIQVGTDAAVTIPEGGGKVIDFRFVNNKKYPVRIIAYCMETESNGKPLKTVTVEIWGTLEEDDYMPVEFDNSYGGVYDYDRIIDPAYPGREGYKIKLTHDEYGFSDETGEGIRTLTHRKVYDANGKLVEDRIINRRYSEGFAMDTYYFMK